MYLYIYKLMLNNISWTFKNQLNNNKNKLVIEQ